MPELDRKVNTVFAGKVVRKEHVARIGGRPGKPVEVLDAGDGVRPGDLSDLNEQVIGGGIYGKYQLHGNVHARIAAQANRPTAILALSEL